MTVKSEPAPFWQPPPWVIAGVCRFDEMIGPGTESGQWPWNGDTFLAVSPVHPRMHLRQVVDGNLEETEQAIPCNPAAVRLIARIPAPPMGDK